MPSHPHPTRLSAAMSPLPHRRRPWVALPESARLQLARQIARLLQRRSHVEARHADQRK